MAKAKLYLEIALIFGFMLILLGTLFLLIGAFKNNNTLLLIAFIPLGLGIIDYIVLIIIFLIKIKKNR
ncbi:MAG: hypothetical protein IJS83_06845 [Acholeplasmatales bacterium]|nr:hypothetical protein [Acholeplasmatales bacterium]